MPLRIGWLTGQTPLNSFCSTSMKRRYFRNHALSAANLAVLSIVSQGRRRSSAQMLSPPSRRVLPSIPSIHGTAEIGHTPLTASSVTIDDISRNRAKSPT